MKKFECTHCGNCCRQQGDLRLIPEDIKSITNYLNLSYNEFIELYNIINKENKLYFIDTHGCCPFLNDNNECVLQDVKPFFCKKYIPFLDNEDSLIYSVCDGLGKGKDWSEEEINTIYNEMLEHLVI